MFRFLCITSLNRCSRDVMASRLVIVESCSDASVSSNENSSRVSKQFFAKSSRRPMLPEQSSLNVMDEWMEPLFRSITILRMNSVGTWSDKQKTFMSSYKTTQYLLVCKFRRSRVPTRASSSRRISKLCNQSRVDPDQ